MAILILNPAPLGATHVSERRAAKHVRSGLAVYGDPLGRTIRFKETHHRHKAAQQQGSETPIRGHFFNCAAAIPVVNARELLAPKGRLTPKSPRGLRKWVSL